MNEDLMKSMGFERELNLIKHGRCPFCGKMISPCDFRDKLSLKEYGISGLCQTCQDEVFGNDEEMCDMREQY